jgi:penicillin-binding protein 2
MSGLLSNPNDTKVFAERYKILYAAIAVASALFFLRLYYLQIHKGTELRQFSERNRIKEEKVYAPRGMILDRDGEILVDNRPGFVATITPQYASKLKETAKAISPILDVPVKKIIQIVRKERRKYGSFRPVRVKENLSRDQVTRIERLRLQHPGLEIEAVINRTYLLKENGAQVFGYIGEISKKELAKLNKKLPKEKQYRQGDLIGQSGIETVYNDTLRGRDGRAFVQVDAHGRKAASLTPGFLSSFENEESFPGKTLKLTIDADIQRATYEAFVGSNRLGGAVAIDPRTGEILAMVSAPSFDPNKLSTRSGDESWNKWWRQTINDPYKPLRNKVVQDHNAPGSTFKALVGLAALQEGKTTINQVSKCHGYLVFGRRRYHCHLKYGHGATKIYEALERSCNVYFYRMGIALGIDLLSQYGAGLGVGVKTGISLPDEQPGLMPTKDWKLNRFGEPWQPGETLSNAIGQGFVLMTPIQLAQLYATIANEGPVYKPYIVKEVLDVHGKSVEEFKPELVRNISNGTNSELVITKENFKAVKQGLWQVANGPRGTAKWWKIPGVEFAGKTGTSQFFTLNAEKVYEKCEERPFDLRHHGWFVGFAPADKPEIVVAVLAEHSCHGSTGGAPVVRNILFSYFKKYHPDWLKYKDWKPPPVPRMPGPQDDIPKKAEAST